MKTNKILFFSIVLAFASYRADAQTQNPVETFSSLEIGYTVAQDLPPNVVLGVNGHVYIQDGRYDKSKPLEYDPKDQNGNPSGSYERHIDPDYKDDFLLWVERGVVSEDLAIAERNIWLADYVFEPDYDLRTLEEMQSYVEENRHLPGVIGQSELDAQGHYRINEMLIGQLQNIEELLLHTIEQEKKIDAQAQENEELSALVIALEQRLHKLEAKE